MLMGYRLRSRSVGSLILPFPREMGAINIYMGRIEKTVFISYRRTNAPWPPVVSQNLTQHGYDVFYNFKGIVTRDFERVILENINAPAHFLVLLTPSALEHCGDPADGCAQRSRPHCKVSATSCPSC